ncbi:MAG: hypothetical protein IKK29_04040 [Christensenellaceae bacterium]|nr:hypothetical protein [Christensenellaceae bacterium]
MFEFIFKPETIGLSLGIMLKGMIGIFAVILVIMLFVKVMSKAFNKKN